MCVFTTCQIVNECDKKNIILNVQWSEEEVKLTILREGKAPLIGVTTKSKLFKDAEEFFATTKEQFLDEIKDELAGKAEEIDFRLENSNFRWRKKKLWTRGIVKCTELNDIIPFSDELFKILIHNINIEENLLKLKLENENFKCVNKEMQETMAVMAEDKRKMEDKFFRRFIPVLNSKKRRIRELQLENKKLRKQDNTYELSTDESEDEVIQKHQSPRKITKLTQLNVDSDSNSSVEKIPENNNNEEKEEIKDETRKSSVFDDIMRAIEEQCCS